MSPHADETSPGGVAAGTRFSPSPPLEERRRFFTRPLCSKAVALGVLRGAIEARKKKPLSPILPPFVPREERERRLAAK